MKLIHRPISILLFFGLALLLAACSTQARDIQEPAQAPVENQENQTGGSKNGESAQASYPNSWVEEVPRIDEQGAVGIEIIPLNPNNPGETLDFQVAMNTHSVDLSMDLAALAKLETDSGYSVQATLWDAPRGGHHLKGILSFPATVDGTPIMDGVSKMTITLVNIDAPERVFTWDR